MPFPPPPPHPPPLQLGKNPLCPPAWGTFHPLPPPRNAAPSTFPGEGGRGELKLQVLLAPVREGGGRVGGVFLLERAIDR